MHGTADEARQVVARAVAAVARVVTAHATAATVKGWRDQHPPTEHARFDLALVDHYEPQVLAALRARYSPGALRAAILTARQIAPLRKAPGPDDAMRQVLASIARGALRPNDPNDAALSEVLRRLYAESWVTGGYVAGRQVGPDAQYPAGMWDSIVGIDWNHWTPGWVDAAILAEGTGLSDLLDGAGVVIRGIDETTLGRLGDAIAEGLLNGDSVDTIARGLTDVLGDAFRALVIAQTETARAMTAASLDVYAASGITRWDWLTTSGACPLCLNREAANPHDRGDPAPPGHPMCRCAVAPAVRSLPLPGFPDAVVVDLDGDAQITEA